jgi:type V secretory pathway adhesin AidA
MSNEIFPPWNGAFENSNDVFHVGKSTIDNTITGEGLIADQQIPPDSHITHLTIPFPDKEPPWPYSTGPGMKLNHSSNPNAYAYKISAAEPGYSIIHVKSLKTIHPGEEMTINYDDAVKLGYGPSQPWYNDPPVTESLPPNQ